MRVGDRNVRGAVYSYCWPETTENLRCDIAAGQLTQPGRIAAVESGQEVRFQIVGDAS